MAMGIWLPGGGGADVDVVTAEAGDVLEGKVIVGPDGEPLTGTLALSGNAADSQVLSGQTYYNTDAKTKRTGSMSNQGAWTSRLGANGKVTIPAGYHNGAGYVDQALPAKGAATYTPGRSNQTIGAGQYLTGAQTIRGDANLLAANIKKGVSIFGIIGSWEGTPGRSNQTIGAGQYLTGAQTIRGDANLLAANIKKGVSIFGIIGSWEGFVTSPLYIYNNGTWGGVQTPDLTATTGYTGIEYSYYAGYQKVAKIENTNSNSGSWGNLILARTNSAVDLSAYKYVNVRVLSTGAGTGYVGVSTAASITSTGGLVRSYSGSPGPSCNVIFKVDVASLSGSYFIYFGDVGPGGPGGGARINFVEIFLTNS